jgi:hypothetical protein
MTEHARLTDSTAPGAASADTYWDACMRAAKRQGLIEVTEKLEELFGDDAGLVQTGGFCMCVQVECPPDHYVWVTFDGRFDDDGNPLDGEDAYTVGYYDSDGQNDTDDYTFCNFANIPEIIASYQRKAAQ